MIEPSDAERAEPQEGEMHKRTLKALKASIKHWEENLATDDPFSARFSSHHCPLCKIFLIFTTLYSAECRGCPIKITTGKDLCQETPWDDAMNGINKWRDGGPKPVAEIQAEIDFLKSLLPEGKE